MSPDRSTTQLSADTPKSKPKPYRRKPTAAMEEITNTIAQRSPIPSLQSELPTRAQYLQIEEAYMNSLNVRRQSKALISREMFARVWDVLTLNPEQSTETPQFRYWARNKFTLGYTGDTPIGEHEMRGPPPENAVLISQSKIVALREDHYDIICEKHVASGHGGRDRTATAIREEYSWLPKELIANFVKVCPTCIYKKCGVAGGTPVPQKPRQKRTVKEAPSSLSPPGSPPFADDRRQNNGYSPALGSTSLFSAFGSPQIGEENGRMSTSRPLSGNPLVDENDTPHAYNSFALLRENNWSAPAALVDAPGGTPISVPLRRTANHSVPAPGPSSLSGLHSLPMSREVSLYQGLPNGWQFQHRDYPSAHDAFTRHEEELLHMHPTGPIPLPSGRQRRPRIPSLAPIVATPSQEADESMCYVKEEPSEDFQQLDLPSSSQTDRMNGLHNISLPLSQAQMPVGELSRYFQQEFPVLPQGANNGPVNHVPADFIENFLQFRNDVLDANGSSSTLPHLMAGAAYMPESPDQRLPRCGEQMQPDEAIRRCEVDELAAKMRSSVSLEEACQEKV